MDTITFLCRVITPMALAGADKNLPEFRAPSLKGGLRFWWRALNSSLRELKELRNKESEIFGSSDETFGRSKFDVFIKEVNNYEPTSANLLPHKSPGARVNAIPVGTEFKVIFNVDRGSVITKSWVKNLFILFSILGGLGKRVRRGFGSFEILEIDGKPFDKEVNLEFVYELIRRVASSPKLYKIDKSGINITEVNESAKYPFLKKVEIGSNCMSNYDALLKRIGQSSHDNNSWGTGGVSREVGRLASPIYVSVIKGKHNSFCPIISTLNPVYPEEGVKDPIDKSKEFKEALL